MVDLSLTSVPAWVVAPQVQDVDPAARVVVILSVGDDGAVESVVRRWGTEAAGLEILVRLDTFRDAGEAVAAMQVVTASVGVGARLMVAGPAGDCAVVRAAALQQGWIDGEIRVGSTEVLDRRVTCAHCGAVNTSAAGIDGVLVCSGCARNLRVHHHFSRRTGTHLGFVADVESSAGGGRS